MGSPYYDNQVNDDDYGDDYLGGRPSPAYTGMSDRHEAEFAPPPEKKGWADILAEDPETTIGKAVAMKGRLEFEKLLRIDGRFEGELVSEGDLIIGPGGVLVGDIKGMGQVIIDGKVIGNMEVKKLDLRDKAAVHGNITCESIRVDPTVVIVGKLNVNPFAPSTIDFDGNIVTPRT